MNIPVIVVSQSICVCVCVCLLPGFHLFVVEKLVCSKDPESYAVCSLAHGRVILGGKVEGEVPDKAQSNKDHNGGTGRG